MALMEATEQSALVFQLEGGDANQFEVLRYRGCEGLCQLYRFEIEVSCIESELDFDQIVGQAASLQVTTEVGGRVFRGIVSRFEHTGQSSDLAYFRIELVPSLWLLTHRYQSRIFQQKTTIQIIQQVIADAGLSEDMVDLSGISGTYESRDYCVQYRETDYNFLARLMEQEGIYWYFAASEEGETLAIADSGEYAPMDGGAALPFSDPSGMSGAEEYVSHFRKGQCVRPGQVNLTDFDFEHTALDLHVSADAGRDAGLLFTDFPGSYKEQSAGQALANIRGEEFESGRVMGVGRSTCMRLAPGKTFDLEEHPAASINATYMVTSITHEGRQPAGRATLAQAEEGRGVLDARIRQSLIQARDNENPAIRELATGLLQIATRLQHGDPTAHRALTHWLYHAGQVSRDLGSIAVASGAGPLEGLSIPNLLEDVARSVSIDPDPPLYVCRFTCIPSDVTFRPPRVTPWPVVRGAQTARVVGPSGEEIHTDEHGRVKVQFHWDPNWQFAEDATCWIRVSQGMAGGGYGMMFLPRVGQEVIVDFLEGNPDRPIITGRVYNDEHTPAYTLPAEKTKSYIKTSSSKGGGGTNEIRFEDASGSEQILINAQADHHMFVGNEHRRLIKKDQHLIVENEKREQVDGNRSTAVGGDEAKEVGGTLSLTVGGDVLHDFSANHDLKVASEFHVKGMKIIAEADSGISLKCGSSFVLIDQAGVSIVGPMVKLNSGGAALSSSITKSAASPAEPEKADSATEGRDTTYSGQQAEADAIERGPVEGHWISFRLVDEEGTPVPGEYFEVMMPNDKVISGTLDLNGYRRLWVPEPGDCQVGFPRLAPEDWTKV